MSPTAYDTAWLARLARPNNPEDRLFPSAVDWLLHHQHEDGSWGAELAFAHDRVICTLSALVALTGSRHRREDAQRAVRRAILYLNRERPNLHDDPAETVGFELILPELVRQAQALGLRLPYEDWVFVETIRADKLRRIPPVAVYGGPTPLTHSLEYLGDGLATTLVQRCQFPNGSYGASPSATAYVHMHAPDADALRYLKRVSQTDPSGGVPYVYPIETMEASFVLYFLEPALHGVTGSASQVERLLNSWTPMGTAWTHESTVPDGDDTAVTLSVLTSYGHILDTDVFKLFETDEYFHTFAFERNPSVTTNCHILRALRQYPSTPDRRRMTLKIVHYLSRARTVGAFWQDKWHASPYYATDQAIEALAGISDELVRPAIQWILDTQHGHGAWGFGDGTVEETALAMRALMAAAEPDPALQGLARAALQSGGAYLAERAHDDVGPALWIDKGLFMPPNIVRAIVLGALARWRAFSPGAAR